MASASSKQLISNSQTLDDFKKCFISVVSAHHSPIIISSSAVSFISPQLNDDNHSSSKLQLCFSGHRNLIVAVKSSIAKDGNISVDDNDNQDDDGISLGTMKLPLDTDIPRFETLLFQWGNSLNQGAQLPLPVPLKVDKIKGGVRLGFVEIDDGKTEVRVYIDCKVSKDSNKSDDPPMFIATRHGALKNKVPLGEPRIMKSLLAALNKSIEIARL